MTMCLCPKSSVCGPVILYILISMVRISRFSAISDTFEIPENVDVSEIIVRPKGFSGQNSEIEGFCETQKKEIYSSILQCGNGTGTSGYADEVNKNVKSLMFVDESVIRRKLEKILEHDGEAVTIIHSENILIFYEVIHEITHLLALRTSHLHWNPCYILTWPESFNGISEVVQLLENVTFKSHVRHLNAKSEIYIVTPFKNGKLLVWEIYNIANLTLYNTLPIYPKSGKIAWYTLSNKISRRSDFEGAEITAAAANDPVFSLETKFTDDLKRFKSGSAVSRFWFIRAGLNFTERAILGKWTSETKNGTLIGSGVQIMEGKIDLGIAQTPMTLSKKLLIDFLQPTDDRTLKIFFVQPKASQYRDIYECPFDRYLWVTIVLIWISLIILIRLIVLFKSLVCFREYPEDRNFAQDTFIWALSTATQHGWHNLPYSFSIRIVHFVAHLTALLCYTAFVASIVSFLSVKSAPLKSFQDLLNASYRIYSNENSTPIMYVLPILHAQHGFPEKVLIHEEKSIKKSSTPGSGVIAFAYVFFVQARYLNYTEKTLCESFSSVAVLKAPRRFGMIVRKGSPYREFFNHQIMLMKERGFNHRYKVTYTKGTEARCLDYSRGHYESLGIDDVLSASLILLMGSILSLLFLTTELFVHFKVGGNSLKAKTK